jgi:hypothetical protein
MVPGKPYHPVPIRRQPCRAEEIISAHQHTAGRSVSLVEIDGDDSIDGFALPGVVFADPDPAPSRLVEHAIAVSEMVPWV